MAVFINEECICCDACIDECPNGAIVDDSKHPDDAGIFYVHADKCDECGGSPACIDACPSDAIALAK